jgi:hypothetical protein
MKCVNLLLGVATLVTFGYATQGVPKNASFEPAKAPYCNCQTDADCSTYNKNSVCSWDDCTNWGNNNHVCALSDPPKQD